MSSGDSMVQQEQLLQQLHAKVADVYSRCGFDAGSSPTTLFMLSDLEARLEFLLSAIGQMQEEYVIKAERDKEKKRRERKRAEQQVQLNPLTHSFMSAVHCSYIQCRVTHNSCSLRGT